MLLNWTGWVKGILWVVVIGWFGSSGVADGEADRFGEEMAIQQVHVLIPMSVEMVDNAIDILAKGWAAMKPYEQEVFLLLFDPSGTGEIDDQYVAKVLQNYQKIRAAFDRQIVVEYEPNSNMCIDQRLFFTNLFKLHVCPYILNVTNARLKARTLIHELAHKGLLVIDRPYYSPASLEYATLTPRGSWMTRLPLLGPIFRELLHSDTLYHPDAYAHFASAMSGQPGVIELYLDHEAPEPAACQDAASGSSSQKDHTVTSWIQRH